MTINTQKFAFDLKAAAQCLGLSRTHTLVLNKLINERKINSDKFKKSQPLNEKCSLPEVPFMEKLNINLQLELV